MGPKGNRPSLKTALQSTSAGTARATRRGRPTKFGRPSQVVALTLPEDVLDALRTLHSDPGWAIVRLVEQGFGAKTRKRWPKKPAPFAELVHLPGQHALILVQPQVFKHLRGVSTIPLVDGRAFLAFDHPGGLAELEVAILDRIEVAPARSAEHTHLMRVRDIVRAWRRNSGLVFRVKSIIVVEGLGGIVRRPIAALAVQGGQR
jgi:hypothetical protein